MGGSPSNTTSTQKVEPWDAAKPYYETLYQQAQNAFNNTNRTPYAGQLYAGPNNDQMQALWGFEGQANSPAWQNASTAAIQLGQQAASGTMLDGGMFRSALGPQAGAAVGGVRPDQLNLPGAVNVPQLSLNMAGQTPTIANVNANGPQYNSLARGLEDRVLAGDMLGGNPYLDAATQASIRPVQDQLMRSILPSLQDQSIAQGAYGGSGNGTMNALAISDFTRQAQDLAAQINLGNYQQERGYQQQVMGNSLGRDTSLFQQTQALEAQRAMQQAQLESQMTMQQRALETQGALQTQQLGTQAGLQNQQIGAQGALQTQNLGMQGALQGQQLDVARQNQLTQLLAGNYGMERATQLQAPQMILAGAESALRPAQLLDLAGSQQQSWAQNALNAELQRYNINQAAPWAGLGEWAQILNGGGFSSAGVTQPGPSGAASFLQGAAGAAGITNALFPQALPAAGNWLANLFRGGGTQMNPGGIWGG